MELEEVRGRIEEILRQIFGSNDCLEIRNRSFRRGNVHFYWQGKPLFRINIKTRQWRWATGFSKLPQPIQAELERLLRAELDYALCFLRAPKTKEAIFA